MQMQIKKKTALEGERTGKGEKEYSCSPNIQYPNMSPTSPLAQSRQKPRKMHNNIVCRKEGIGRTLCITSVLRGELPHHRGQALVELVLAGDEGLADGLLAEAKHAAVAAHLVHEGLKHHPFLREALLLVLGLLLLRVHGLLRLSLHSRTHPPPAPTALPWALASQRQVTHK